MLTYLHLYITHIRTQFPKSRFVTKEMYHVFFCHVTLFYFILFHLFASEFNQRQNISVIAKDKFYRI